MKIGNRLPLRRPRWLSRPVTLVVAVLLGLGGLGGAAGAVLGELGAATSAPHHEGWHAHDDDGPGSPFHR